MPHIQTSDHDTDGPAGIPADRKPFCLRSYREGLEAAADEHFLNTDAYEQGKRDAVAEAKATKERYIASWCFYAMLTVMVAWGFINAGFAVGGFSMTGKVMEENKATIARLEAQLDAIDKRLGIEKMTIRMKGDPK